MLRPLVPSTAAPKKGDAAKLRTGGNEPKFSLNRCFVFVQIITANGLSDNLKKKKWNCLFRPRWKCLRWSENFYSLHVLCDFSGIIMINKRTNQQMVWIYTTGQSELLLEKEKHEHCGYRTSAHWSIGIPFSIHSVPTRLFTAEHPFFLGYINEF